MEREDVNFWAIRQENKDDDHPNYSEAEKVTYEGKSQEQLLADINESLHSLDITIASMAELIERAVLYFKET